MLNVEIEAIEKLRERAEKAEARVAELVGILDVSADRHMALDARVRELEAAICRHVRAREGEIDERPDITVAVLYRIEREIKARESDSVSPDTEEKKT